MKNNHITLTKEEIRSINKFNRRFIKYKIGECLLEKFYYGYEQFFEYECLIRNNITSKWEQRKLKRMFSKESKKRSRL